VRRDGMARATGCLTQRSLPSAPRSAASGVREVFRIVALRNDAATTLQPLLRRAGQIVVGGYWFANSVSPPARAPGSSAAASPARHLQIRIVGMEISPGVGKPGGLPSRTTLDRIRISAYSGWWNWSTTCGSGGPKRRANSRNSRAVSFCRETRAPAGEDASSISRKGRLKAPARSDAARLQREIRLSFFSRIVHRGPLPVQSAFAPEALMMGS